MILDPDTCMYDAYIYPDTRDYDALHICMMHLSMILNPNTCMYDAYIYVPRSLTLKQACVYDAYFMHVWSIYDDYWSSFLYDAHIYDPWFMHVWCTNGSCIYDVYMMRYFLGTDGRTNERTDGQGDSRSLMRGLGMIYNALRGFFKRQLPMAITIWVMPKWRSHEFWSCFPYIF